MRLRKLNVPSPTLGVGEAAGALLRPLALERAERACAELAGEPHAVLFASARGALAAAAACVAGGREVTLPAYTCIAVANGMRSAGVPYGFVDVAEDGTVPVERWEGAQVALVQDTYGFPAAAPEGAVAIRDCAHRADLLHADGVAVAVTSFEHSKWLSAGRGGLAVTRDAALAERMREWRDRVPQPGHRARLRHGLSTLVLLLLGRLLFAGRLPRAQQALAIAADVLAPSAIAGQSIDELGGQGVGPGLLGAPNGTVCRLVVSQLRRSGRGRRAPRGDRRALRLRGRDRARAAAARALPAARGRHRRVRARAGRRRLRRGGPLVRRAAASGRLRPGGLRLPVGLGAGGGGAEPRRREPAHAHPALRGRRTRADRRGARGRRATRDPRVSRRVLVLSYFFPPLGGAGVQRTLKHVKYLPAAGWDPTVVTTRSTWYPAKDPSLARDVPPGTPVLRAADPGALRLATMAASRLGPLAQLTGWPDEAAAWIPGAARAARPRRPPRALRTRSTRPRRRSPRTWPRWPCSAAHRAAVGGRLPRRVGGEPLRRRIAPVAALTRRAERAVRDRAEAVVVAAEHYVIGGRGPDDPSG